jgi:osmotically-inducible protein OsmY
MPIRTDEEIKKEVVDSLYWDNRIDASDIKVEVESGEVILTGSAPTYRAVSAASDDTWFVKGVIAVENHLAVEYPSTVEIPTDIQIREQLEDAFRWDPDLVGEDITPFVSNGWVTLEGTVDAYWMKIQAERVAVDTVGVVGTTNKIAVVPTEKITDESIAKDVVEAIARNLHVLVDNVTVEVENGRVTLSGTVSSWTAKSAAFNAALYTLGVVDVEDHMMVRSEAPTPA